MMHHLWAHGVRAAQRASKQGKHKSAGIMYIIVGFFLAPILIGIPLIFYGLWKLLK